VHPAPFPAPYRRLPAGATPARRRSLVRLNAPDPASFQADARFVFDEPCPAESGGICLFVDAYRQVRDRVKETFTDLGEKGTQEIHSGADLLAMG
jgi:hypothetical protein